MNLQNALQTELAHESEDGSRVRAMFHVKPVDLDKNEKQIVAALYTSGKAANIHAANGPPVLTSPLRTSLGAGST